MVCIAKKRLIQNSCLFFLPSPFLFPSESYWPGFVIWRTRHSSASQMLLPGRVQVWGYSGRPILALRAFEDHTLQVPLRHFKWWNIFCSRKREREEKQSDVTDRIRKLHRPMLWYYYSLHSLRQGKVMWSVLSISISSLLLTAILIYIPIKNCLWEVYIQVSWVWRAVHVVLFQRCWA